MWKAIAVVFVASVCQAQSIGGVLVLSNPPVAAAGSQMTVQLSLVPGTTAIAALQWTTALPFGANIAWSIGGAGIVANKTISCANGNCVIVGTDGTGIGAGVIATGVLSIPASLSGPQMVSITNALGSSAPGEYTGVGVASMTFTVTTSLDANGDGSTNLGDLSYLQGAFLGLYPCVGPGRCGISMLAAWVASFAGLVP